MADSSRSIDVLLREVADPLLRQKLQDSVNNLREQIDFGLVFEGHHPEISRLYGYDVRPGNIVVRKLGENTVYRVLSIKDGIADCLPASVDDPSDHSVRQIPTGELVVCRHFGDPIYPSLTMRDAVKRNPQKPWHCLIEADNYHALQLLQYTHSAAVDVIYIDPPYNTGASDWKYLELPHKNRTGSDFCLTV